jgi:IS605 OrfB family transposase
LQLHWIEHPFPMAPTDPTRPWVHRTASIRLRVTRRQANRCYGLLRSGGHVWAWLIDTNRLRQHQSRPPVVSYQALCKELTGQDSFGELSAVGARSVLRRYSCAWFHAAKRRRQGEDVGFPRRKRALVPVSFHHGVFELDGERVRLPVAKGRAELWVRLARPIPYPAEQVRAVTLFSEGGLLWLSVTAVVSRGQHNLDQGRVAGVDLGIIHPYAVVTQEAAMLVSGRAIRAENWLHLHDRQARQVAVSRRAPKPGRRGSRRWRRYRLKERRFEARHRRRVRQAHHEAAREVIAFAVERRVGVLVVGDLRGITGKDVGRVQNLRLRQWRRTHLMQALRDKAEVAGIQVQLVDERGTSSTCVVCRRRVPKPSTRQFRCPHCNYQAHRDLVGAANIAAKASGGGSSAALPAHIEHRRVGTVPARRDRRRHLHDRRRRRSCLASGHLHTPCGTCGCRSPHATFPLQAARIKQRRPSGHTLLEGALAR